MFLPTLCCPIPLSCFLTNYRLNPLPSSSIQPHGSVILQLVQVAKPWKSQDVFGNAPRNPTICCVVVCTTDMGGLMLSSQRGTISLQNI